MRKSTISIATLIATAVCSMSAYTATSDSIFGAGLLSPSSTNTPLLFPAHQLESEFGVGLVNSEQANSMLVSSQTDIAAYSFTLANLAASGVDVSPAEHSETSIESLADSAWLPVWLADFSHEEHATAIHADDFEWHSVDEFSELENGQIHSFSFELKTDPMADKPIVVKGLRQYLALADNADFDLKVLRGRVINLSTDPLEYSIMDDLCFIKHCFF